jgi:predicted membrane channel-forming protein YqfA (hemolysin III family)
MFVLSFILCIFFNVIYDTTKKKKSNQCFIITKFLHIDIILMCGIILICGIIIRRGACGNYKKSYRSICKFY